MDPNQDEEEEEEEGKEEKIISLLGNRLLRL